LLNGSISGVLSGVSTPTRRTVSSSGFKAHTYGVAVSFASYLGSHNSDRNNSVTINLVGTIVLPPMTAEACHLMVPPTETFFVQ
jgi:hypothetical protein